MLMLEPLVYKTYLIILSRSRNVKDARNDNYCLTTVLLLACYNHAESQLVTGLKLVIYCMTSKPIDGTSMYLQCSNLNHNTSYSQITYSLMSAFWANNALKWWCI